MRLATLATLVVPSSSSPVRPPVAASRSPGPLVAAQPDGFRCLAEAYPDSIAALRADPATGRAVVVLRDGHAIAWDDGIATKSAGDQIQDPDLDDMFARRYPAGAEATPPAADDDPGRARVTALFDGLYGRTEPEVRSAVESVAWLPRLGGKRWLPFNRRQGGATALRRVIAELETLPASLRPFFTETAGTLNRRAIAGTTRPSAHSWGIAIDLDVRHADYWRWNQRADGTFPYRNRIPIEIVRAFERHGFIWGGRWSHYDTMHFEYRPELLNPRCVRRAQPQEVAR
jgi:hypothetical protein